MAAFQHAFPIFNADDVPGLASQLNDWGGNLETAVSDLRTAILLQSGELQTLRDGLIVMEGAHARVQQFGSHAVAELEVLMHAFRSALVLSKSEQVASGEALKEELRVFTGHLQAKFLEVETVQQQFRFQETEALKTELRALVAQLEARFAVMDAAVVVLQR